MANESHEPRLLCSAMSEADLSALILHNLREYPIVGQQVSISKALVTNLIRSDDEVWVNRRVNHASCDPEEVAAFGKRKSYLELVSPLQGDKFKNQKSKISARRHQKNENVKESLDAMKNPFNFDSKKSKKQMEILTSEFKKSSHHTHRQGHRQNVKPMEVMPTLNYAGLNTSMNDVQKSKRMNVTCEGVDDMDSSSLASKFYNR